MIRRPLAAGLVAVGLAVIAFGRPAVAGTFDVPTDDFYTVFEDHQLVVDVAGGVFSNDLSSRGPCVAAQDMTGLQGLIPLDSLGPNGQFSFVPKADFNGATTFTYTLGLVNGTGCDSTGNSATVTITVFELNDPPGIVLDDQCANGVTVTEDSGPFADSGHCVEMVSFGPVDENNQSFDAWVVSSTHPELFSAKPKISQVDGPFGRLTFTPAANANGASTVTVRGRDSGGTADGGDDTSDGLKFKITITAVEDPATPGPPTEEPTIEPTPEETAAEPSAAIVTLAPATLVPSVAPTPGSTPVAGETASDADIPWLPIGLGVLLVVLLIGFGAALMVPRWRANRRA